MSPDAIELAVRGDTGTGSYRFICPACMTLVQKRADRKIVDLLSSVGVSMAPASAPSLLEGLEGYQEAPASASGGGSGSGAGVFEVPFEPLRPAAAAHPAFTYDDLLNFHFLLEDDAWLAEMIGEPAADQARRRRPKRS